MFLEVLTRLPAHLADFRVTPPQGLGAAFDTLSVDMRRDVIARGEEAMARPWPLLTASAYLEYRRNGNRTRFEAGYFGRRRMLNALAVAELAEGKGRFVDAIVDGIVLICEESGWQLPAHNSYIRNGPRLALPDSGRPVIDLFAAETGAQLAVLAQCLSGALETISPEIVRRIDCELETRIFAPYRTEHFWWMGNGNEPMNNWTAWCTQNVLLATFCRPTDQVMRRFVVEKAAGSLDAFLKDYGADGACEEGPLYYRHAGLCLFGALSVLSTVAPEAFAQLQRAPKLRNIAEYIGHVHVDGPYYLNFGDGSAFLTPCGGREFLFGYAVGSDLLSGYAAADCARRETVDNPEEINLWYRLLDVETHADRLSHTTPEAVPADHFYPSIGLTIVRDGRYTLGVKAGNNGDSHNHNDVGSFTLYKDGRPFLIDLGVESYTAKTFSPQRYEIWTMQSAWHNLPTFEGVMQKAGEAFAARNVSVLLGEREALVDMELAGAYPPEARLETYRRIIRLIKGEGVEVVDTYAGERAGEVSLLFAERPELSDGTISLPTLGSIALSGAGALRLEEVAITDETLRRAWPDRIFRVLVPITGQQLQMNIV